MKLKITLFLCTLLLAGRISSQTYGASNFTLISLLDPETTYNPDSMKYSGCWGWYQPSKNKEYAIACSHKGTYWIDVTVPATPSVSAYKAGRKSGCTWREAKSYRNYLYVISDDFGNNSLQIFDMQYLPDSVHKVYDGQTLFVRGHTLYINQDKLYVGSVSSGSNFSSMNVYSLANPVSPVLIRKLDQDYPLINHVHDMYVRNDTVYASCGNQGLYVYKLMANNTFSLLGSLTTYPYSGYNHSSALTPNGQTLVFMDEVPAGLPIKVADVNNLSNMQVLATINQYTNTTPHNPFMVNNQYCFASCYQDGLQLYDISNPSSPFLAGYFDTYPQSGGNNNTWPSGADYSGQWGAYPYLPSGLIFALDRVNGAFFLKTTLYQAPLISAEFSMPVKACVGSPVNLVNSSSGANTFTWTFPSGATGSQTLGNASVMFNTPGTYTVMLSAANASFSSSTAQTITIISSSVIASVVSASNSACNSCSTGVIVVSPSGGTSPYTYTWHPQGPNSPTLSNLAPGCYTVDIRDTYGCTATTNTCITFNLDVGIQTINSAMEPDIFPNPATHQVFVRYNASGIAALQLKNILGEVILQKQFRGPISDVIDVRPLTNGTYIISITENNITKNKKLIIQK